MKCNVCVSVCICIIFVFVFFAHDTDPSMKVQNEYKRAKLPTKINLYC